MGEYIVMVNSHINTADGVDNIMQQAQHQRVMLSSDTAEIGKNTILYVCLKKSNRIFEPNTGWFLLNQSVL